MRPTISSEIVRLQAEYYGKGPTRAKTHILEDVVVVVLEESFTRAEKTLAERGEREAIQHIRRRFQQQMKESFSSVVEQATGRRVRVFLSETDIDHDVSVEVFLLADKRTDGTDVGVEGLGRAAIGIIKHNCVGASWPLPSGPGTPERTHPCHRELMPPC